jgi:hypothetical protein
MTALLVAAIIATPINLTDNTDPRSTRRADPRDAVVQSHRPRLLRMARCESGRRWHIATGNGYYGGLQFTLRSWQTVGGRGYPHHASRLEQMYRAVQLMRAQGWGAWPACQHA